MLGQIDGQDYSIIKTHESIELQTYIQRIMSWTQAQSNQYTRPLGENEAFIKLIGDRAQVLKREQWSVTCSARFSLLQPLTDEELKTASQRAWINLRFENPSIAARTSDDVLAYDVPSNDSEAEAWANETFCVHDKEVVMDDFLASLQPKKYATAHLLLGESAIVLHLSHWRTDGYGALHLLNSFLRHLASAQQSKQLAWGEEAARLTPSVEEVLQLPKAPTQETQELARKYLATAGLFHGSTGLAASKDNPPLPSGTRGITSSFSLEETSTVTDACNAKSITLEAAVQASCAAATYSSAATADQDKPYTSTIRLNLRPHMSAPYNGPAYAAALCTGGYMEQVPASQSWIENAEQFTRAYARGVTEDFLQSRRAYAQACLAAMKMTPPPPQPVLSAIDISSVGNAEELVRAEYVDSTGRAALSVDGVTVGVETLTRQVYCFMSIFRSQLQLRLVYNEAFYDTAQIVNIVEEVKKDLWTNLTK